MSSPTVQVPQQFICPITLEIFHQPVMTRDGRRFERDAIIAWLREGGTCPLTRTALRVSDLIPDRGLEVQISAWKFQHNIKDTKTEPAISAAPLALFELHRVSAEEDNRPSRRSRRRSSIRNALSCLADIIVA